MILPAARSASMALAIAVVAVAAPVCAQIPPSAPTGSRIKQDPDVQNEQMTRRIEKDFAQCVYSRHPILANQFLENSDSVSVNFEMLGISLEDFREKFSMTDCLEYSEKGNMPWFADTMLSFHTGNLRSLLAEEAYLLSNSQPMVLSEDDEEVLASRNFYSPSDSGEAAQARAIAAFSDCVVFHAPDEADALLRTAPTSAEERRATQALVPTISGCIYEGQAVELTVTSIRKIVADGLWSRSHDKSLSTASAMTDVASSDR